MSVATQTTAIDSLVQRAELLAEKLNNFKNTYLSFASNQPQVSQVEPVIETPVAETPVTQTTQVSDSLIDDIMSDINFDAPAVEQAPVAPVQPVAQPAIRDINDINIDDIMANLDLSDATMTH
jgi:hypothetical protein